MKYLLKSVVALAVAWAISHQLAAMLAVAIAAHAIYRSTRAGRLARIARLESKLAACLGDAADSDQIAAEVRDALERFLRRFIDGPPMSAEEKATARNYRLELATAQQDAKESEAAANQLSIEIRRLRQSLARRDSEPADAPLF